MLFLLVTLLWDPEHEPHWPLEPYDKGCSPGGSHKIRVPDQAHRRLLSGRYWGEAAGERAKMVPAGLCL